MYHFFTKQKSLKCDFICILSGSNIESVRTLTHCIHMTNTIIELYCDKNNDCRIPRTLNHLLWSDEPYRLPYYDIHVYCCSLYTDALAGALAETTGSCDCLVRTG